MPDQKEFRTLHSVPLQSQSAVVQESSRIPKVPLWVRHSPTHSKHKFTIVNYGQSEQVMRQFFKGSNGGKPYVTPEPTDTTSTEANILDRREAREIAERIIKEELNRAKVAKFGKAATGNYEENETERGGEALQVEQSGYSGDRRTQYDWSFTNNNVQEFPNGYDGLSALPEHEASISDRVISNKLTEEQPVPTVTPPPAPPTTPSAQLLFTTPVSDVDLQKLCATLPAAGTAPAPVVGQAGPRVIEYAIRKTVDGALTGGSPAFGCRPCEGRNSEPSPFQALPAVAPLPSTQQPLPVPVPPAPQPSPSSSAPKRIPAPAPFDDVSLLAPPRSTEGYVTGGATETAPVFAPDPTESDASKYGEPPPPPSYPSPGAPLPQPAVLSYPISGPNLVPPPTPVVAQASPSPPYPTLVTPPPAAPAPQQQQVYPSSINLAELPDPPYETEPPPAPPPPPPPPSAAPLPAPTTQTPSPAPTYAPYPQAPPAPPSYSESKSTASPSTSYVTQAPFTTSVQTTKPTTQGRTYSIVPTTVPTPPPVQPTTTTTSYVPPPIVEAPVGGEKDEAVSTYSQSNTMVYPLPKPSPPPSPPTPPPPPPPPRSTDPPAFVQVPASYSNIEEETSEPEVPEIVQPVPAPAYQTKSPEPKENNYVKPTNVQPKKESTPVESYVKEEQVEESTATAPATEDVVEGAESQKESYTSSSSQKVSYVPETAPQLPEEPEPEAEVELQTESSYNNLEEDHEQNVGPPTIIETEEKPKLPLVNEEAYLTNNRQKIQVKPSPYVDTPHPTLRPYPQRTIAPRPSLPIESYQERFQPPPAPVLQPQPRPLQPIPLPAQPQLPYTAPIQSYQPFQPVQPAPYHPIPYQPAPSYQSVPQGQQALALRAVPRHVNNNRRAAEGTTAARFGSVTHLSIYLS
ncbi:unnamed protein product [Nippostrongylus brasiliensis]|uniref:ZM domain-containing protein n=1 Tax=Nippostrongylus brasiliensis TaxID=27835 RepID=A0A0N4YET2_NIPBR|nr:unnamed protein product [Nippostrongylus brasiliensis]